MEQPPLPDIDPYVNRNLFSEHYLKKLPTQDESWQVEQDRLKLAMQAATNLYAGREEEWAGRNEPQLEDKLVRPMLQALGHKFEVQPSLPTAETVRRPDYAFFATDEERLKAKRDHDGQAEYFNKAIAIGDAKRWDRSLDKKERSGRDSFDVLSPSWQIDYYLRMSGVKWGILTNGRMWRLYNQDTSFRLDICYEIDLPRLLAAKDLETFKYFYLFFRHQAFVPDAEGLCFLDRVYQGSLEYAHAVGDDLKENVYKALRLLAEGFLHTQGNNLDPVHDLDEIHANSLVLLYRLLFINYAEDRGLLPRHNALYKDSYGLVSMQGEIASRLQRGDSLSPLHTTYWGKLKTLFELINRGTEGLGVEAETMEVPPYNGGLFDPEKHPFLEQHEVADKWVSQVVDLLARSQGEGLGRGFVDYSSLDVRHLGSIYEGLLEYKLRVADQEMVAVKRGGKEQWIPAGEAEGSRVLDRAQPGSVYLATDRGERKATGSYYTPDYIVKYIVDHTVGPLIEQRMREDNPIDGILSLKVLDPAMGSGHFLVEATDRLAHALVEALGGTDKEPEEEDIRWARREVVERCVYGVDLNPLAVELAKLSLWLHTVAEGKPLNFLDHHLKVGNSLIGAWVDDLASLPVPRKRGPGKEAEAEVRQMNLFEIRLDEQLPVMLGKVLEIARRGSQTLEDIKAKAGVDQAVEQLKAPFKAVADLWVSTYFGNDVTQGEYQEALEHIGEPGRLLRLPSVERARDIAGDKRFFHWELEFPEVFYQESKRRDNPGFRAAVGNPPYVQASAVLSDEESAELMGERRIIESMGFQTLGGRWDLYIAFVERALQLLATEGQGSMIVSATLELAPYAHSLRELMLKETQIRQLDFFPGVQIFPGVGVQNTVFLVRKEPPRPDSLVRRVVHTAPGLTETESLAPAQQVTAGHRVFNPLFMPEIQRLADAAIFVGELCYVCGGAQLQSDQESHRREFTKDDLISPVRHGPYDKRYVEGKDLERWETLRVRYLEYDSKLSRIKRPRFRELFETPKIMIGSTSGAVCDRENTYANHSVILCVRWCDLTGVQNRSLTKGLHLLNELLARKHDRQRLEALSAPYDIGYLACLANSRLLQTFMARNAARGRIGITEDTLKEMPVRPLAFGTPRRDRAQLFSEGKGLAASWATTAAADRALEAYAGFVGSEIGRWIGRRHEARPEQTDVIHDLLAYLAEQMMEMNRSKRTEAAGLVDWLADYTGVHTDDWQLKTIVKAYWEHGWDDMLRALRQNRKAIQKGSGRDVESRDAQEAIRRELEKSMTKLTPLVERIASTDRLIDLIVYRLYGLTEEEVAIVEESMRQ